MPFRRARSLLLMALLVLAGAGPLVPRPARAQTNPAPPPASTLDIVYLGLAQRPVAPESALGQPATDDGLAGARVALADDNTTGRFIGQGFALDTAIAPDEAGVLAALRDRLGKGARAFVTDLPPALLLKAADLPEARGATLIDATTSDDMLRAEGCRANVLHVLPSRAMRADALMQYLVVKNWRRVMLLAGSTLEDRAAAEAFRRAAKKFQIRIVADKTWTFNPAEQRADTGHFEVNTEVANITQGVDYDILIAADEEDNFADQLGYRATLARPVAGAAGLMPVAWSPVYDETGATQLQNRFFRSAHRVMTERDYGAWMAVRAFGEAVIRTNSTDPATIGAYLRGPKFELAAFKGERLSFRPWDGQLRQPVLLVDPVSLVSISPQPGFLHQFFETDTLGVDQPESACHMH
uniref:Branched-chain amino acid ABC transporter substrate-binding protein n=1 Tax=Acidicaldus sp. TaxID=1872105 RepID=A0A8J4HAU0_9PROT